MKITSRREILTAHLEGPAVKDNAIELADLSHFAGHLQNAVFRVAAVLSGQLHSAKRGPTLDSIAESCTLELLALQPGSVGLAMDFKRNDQLTISAEPHLGETALQKLLEGLPILEDPNAALPEGYDTGVLSSWRDAGRLLGRGVENIRFEMQTESVCQSASFNSHLNEQIAERLQAPVHNRRTVQGRLLMGDFKETGYRCRINPPVGAAVSCTFEDTHRDTVLGALTKFVRVVGEATETEDRITSLHIADIEVLEGGEQEVGFYEGPFDFEDFVSIESAAAEQGVEPVTDFELLLGRFWPEDETADDFVAALRSWRHDEYPGRGRL